MKSKNIELKLEQPKSPVPKVLNYQAHNSWNPGRPLPVLPAMMLAFSLAGSSVGALADEFPAVLDLSTLDGSNGFTITGIDAGDKLGASVSNAGDFNGDGIDDFIIGATRADSNDNENTGKSYVVFGSDQGFAPILDPATLNGSNGFVINGKDADDNLGFSASAAGDVNGDGIDDLIIGMLNTSTPPNESYVVFGSTQSIVAVLDLTALDGSNGFAISGPVPLSFPVSGAGDINGDGIDDVIIGSLLADPNDNLNAGQSHVVFGSNQGFSATFDLATLDGSNGFAINGIGTDDRSRLSVSGAGDINGDGFDDVIIGAVEFFDGSLGKDAGKSYVLFGSDQSFSAALDPVDLDGSNGFVIEGIDENDFMGFSVSRAGDINNDGVDDLIIGAPAAGPFNQSGESNGAGETYIVFGSTQGFSALLDPTTLDGNNGFVINGINQFDNSGISVSDAGDVNGDDIDDVIIGASRADSNDNGAGESYVVFGSNQGFAASLDAATLDGSNGFIIKGIAADDESGRPVSSAGDVNGDGIDDLVIGAQFADRNGNDKIGESYVVFGRAKGQQTSLCATLGADAPPSLLDQDVFKFSGTAGEEITVSMDANPAGTGNGDRATISVFDRIRGVVVFKVEAGALPNDIELTLPADGEYRILVSEQPRFFPGRRFRGDYCVTVESSGNAHQSLAATSTVE